MLPKGRQVLLAFEIKLIALGRMVCCKVTLSDNQLTSSPDEDKQYALDSHHDSHHN